MRSEVIKAFPALFMFLFTSRAYSSFSFDPVTVYAGKHFKDSAGIAFTHIDTQQEKNSLLA